MAGALHRIETMTPREVARRVICIAAIMVVVAAGLCLLDSHEGDAGDLCLVSPLVTTAPRLVLLLPLVGTFVPVSIPARAAYAADRPAPPPKA
jgi:hypothetical protein